jgi:hypothetical protein
MLKSCGKVTMNECTTTPIKRSLTLGHVSTSTRPSATALPSSRVSGGVVNSWFPFIDEVSLPPRQGDPLGEELSSSQNYMIDSSTSK